MKKKNISFSKRVKNFFNDASSSITNKDKLIIIILLIVYSIFAFSNLGSLKNPQTFYQFLGKDNEVGIEIDGDVSFVSKMRHYSGDEVGSYDILYSRNGIDFELLTSFDDDSVFSWSDTILNKDLKYIKIVAKDDSYGYIGEVQLYDQYGNKIKTVSSNENSKVLTDEASTVPGIISYKNSMYFDEVYFARSAYEYLHGIPTMEWVHPPLGKLIQMIPIAVLGMTPFAYRLMGCIAGIIMIAVMYVLAKNIFKSRKFALLAALLMMFDNFHFAQSRMGTVDTFLVLFMMISSLYMYKYISLKRDAEFREKRKNLALSGIFFGLATCVKWTGLYFGLGLAIVFFAKLIYDQKRNEKKRKKQADSDVLKTLFTCLIFFVLVPIIMYVLCYLLFPNVYPGKVNSISGIINQIKDMYSYHSNLAEVHPFQSKWYSWLIMYKPVWYYVGNFGNNLKSTIVGIGNPAIWWFGILGIIYLVFASIKNRKKETLFCLVMIMALWLPYAFIPRGMFMYHFFPVLPFIMIANVSLIKWITEKFNTNIVYFLYLGLVLLFFIYFYPVVSGMLLPTKFIDTIRWFANWVF